MNGFVPLWNIGATEVILTLAVVLLLFGGKKIPELMRGIGKGIREFRKSSRGDYDEEKESKPEPGKDS